MTDQTTGASKRHEDRDAVGSPVQRPVRPDPERDAFEAAVEKWTGRNMAYHHHYGTTGLEFAWFCWQAGRDAERKRQTNRRRGPMHSCDDPLCMVCGSPRA